MASIEKIYGNRKQFDELYCWLYQNNKHAIKFMFWDFHEWDDEDNRSYPIALFPQSVDMWLLDNCPIEWVIGRIKDQYDIRRGKCHTE